MTSLDMLVRKRLDRLYKSARGSELGFDPRLRSSVLFGWLANKAVQRGRAAVRGYPDAFIGRGFRLKNRRQLLMGSSVSIGDFVSVDPNSINGIQIGSRSTIDDYAVLRGSGVVRNMGEGISIGENTSVGANNLILGQGGVLIGNDCLLGPNVSILSENHNFDDLSIPIRNQGETRSRTEIGNDVWIGAGAVVLGGSHIGDGAVVAAGAVVRGKVEPYTVVGGVPARLIRRRGGKP